MSGNPPEQNPLAQAVDAVQNGGATVVRGVKATAIKLAEATQEDPGKQKRLAAAGVALVAAFGMVYDSAPHLTETHEGGGEGVSDAQAYGLRIYTCIAAAIMLVGYALVKGMENEDPENGPTYASRLSALALTLTAFLGALLTEQKDSAWGIITLILVGGLRTLDIFQTKEGEGNKVEPTRRMCFDMLSQPRLLTWLPPVGALGFAIASLRHFDVIKGEGAGTAPFDETTRPAPIFLLVFSIVALGLQFLRDIGVLGWCGGIESPLVRASASTTSACAAWVAAVFLQSDQSMFWKLLAVAGLSLIQSIDDDNEDDGKKDNGWARLLTVVVPLAVLIFAFCDLFLTDIEDDGGLKLFDSENLLTRALAFNVVIGIVFLYVSSKLALFGKDAVQRYMEVARMVSAVMFTAVFVGITSCSKVGEPLNEDFDVWAICATVVYGLLLVGSTWYLFLTDEDRGTTNKTRPITYAGAVVAALFIGIAYVHATQNGYFAEVFGDERTSRIVRINFLLGLSILYPVHFLFRTAEYWNMIGMLTVIVEASVLGLIGSIIGYLYATSENLQDTPRGMVVALICFLLAMRGNTAIPAANEGWGRPLGTTNFWDRYRV
jgi:hypothetical protein